MSAAEEPKPAGEPATAADGAEATEGARDPAAARRLAEIFGEVLPETTSDERPGTIADLERWYVDNRPPHHDTG